MKTELEQRQKHEIDLLRGQLELSVEAMREADKALADGERVQALLVDALKAISKHGNNISAIIARDALAEAGVTL